MIVGAERGVRIVRPLGVAGQGPREGPVQGRITAIEHFGHDVAIDRHGQRLADTHVVVGRLVDRHADAIVTPAIRGHAVELQIGHRLHEGVEGVQRGEPHHVELLRAEQRHVRGGILGEDQTHGVDVGQRTPVLILQVVLGIAYQQRPFAGDEILEHERAGADRVLGQAAGGFDRLPGHDHRRQ